MSRHQRHDGKLYVGVGRSIRMTIRSSQSALNMLTEAVWKSDGKRGLVSAGEVPDVP